MARVEVVDAFTLYFLAVAVDVLILRRYLLEECRIAVGRWWTVVSFEDLRAILLLTGSSW